MDDYLREAFFGHKELKQFHQFEDGRMVTYGYSITYDGEGKEVSRTEPSRISSVGWSDGSPFTEPDRVRMSK